MTPCGNVPDLISDS
jgi:radial spoke head protein 4/6